MFRLCNMKNILYMHICNHMDVFYVTYVYIHMYIYIYIHICIYIYMYSEHIMYVNMYGTYNLCFSDRHITTASVQLLYSSFTAP